MKLQTDRRSTLVAGVAGLAVVLILGPTSAVPAQADVVKCGERVTRDLVLTVDLVNCPGPGLVVGAAGITIDLAGHTIKSSAGDDLAEYPPAIDNLAGHDNVTVKNGGGSEGYWYTYHAVDADGFRVSAMSGFPGVLIEDSTRGIVTATAGVFTQDVTRSRFRRNGDVILGASSLNTVTRTTGDIRLFDGSNRNRVLHNDLSFFKPLWLYGSHRNRIHHNTFDGSVEPIFLQGGSSRNVIHHNTMRQATDGAYGIVLLGAHRNVVRHNVITEALLWEGFRTSGGVVLCGAEDNLIKGNIITDQFVGIGVDNDIACGEDFVSRGNTLRNNTIARSNGAGDYPEQTSDGITIGARSQDTLVVANTLRMNRNHGIHARSVSTTITRNVATLNRLLGIKAVPGAIDGGGNIAFGNGDRRQCVGVVCR
jgi:hypothetical protein